MKPVIDPKVDYVFKKVFGSESNTDVLQDLLEAVLGFPLSGVEIINPFNEKEATDDKLSVLDIKARDASGKWFDVEMQMFSHAAIAPRLLYYWAKLYSGQLVEGQDYRELRPAYSICFLGFRRFASSADVYHNCFELVDRNTGEVLTDHLGMHIIELPKFALAEDELRSIEEVWYYFLRHAKSLDFANMPATMNRPPVMKAMEVLMKMSQDALERDRYDNRIKWERDQRQREYDWQELQARMEAMRASVETMRASEAEAQASVETARASVETARASVETARASVETARASEAAARASVETMRANEAAARAGEAAARASAVEGFVGQIHLCQRLLKEPLTPKEELSPKTVEELQRLADELQRRVISGKEDSPASR